MSKQERPNYKKSYRRIHRYLRKLLGGKPRNGWFVIFNILQDLTGIPTGSKAKAIEVYTQMQQGHLKIDAEKLVLLIARFLKKGTQNKGTSADHSYSLNYAEKAKSFYSSFQWRKLRYQTLQRYGRKCMCCGNENGPFHVDHIKPIRRHWELRLDPENTQVLCEACNHGKGSWDETDFRHDETKLDLETLAEEYAQLVETKSYH